MSHFGVKLAKCGKKCRFFTKTMLLQTKKVVFLMDLVWKLGDRILKIQLYIWKAKRILFLNYLWTFGPFPRFSSRKFGCNISNLKLWQIWQNIEYFSKIGRFWTQNCPYKGCSRWKMEAIFLKGNLKSFSDLFSDFPLLSQFLRYTLISTYRFWPFSHLFIPITPISRRFAAERWSLRKFWLLT